MEELDGKKEPFFLLHIRGLVQGVGFRPFIYRIASSLNLKGWVINRNDGVLIKIQETRSKTEEFVEAIKANLPGAAIIHHISIQESQPEKFESFVIRKSESVSDEITLVSPDIAVCDDCLEDLQTQAHRKGYPFINCTNCGPRFSIIRELPYDRPNTTMDVFPMCPQCASEYSDITDRRFHAQPIACNHCGPRYTFKSDITILIDQREIIRHLAREIENGKVFAVKGLGGYHLICDALNDQAVNRIRDIKNRDGKPFALMAKSLKEVEVFADISKEERELLTSWRRPIVLLKRKNDLADRACSSLDKVGIMLPYIPFHYLLFEHLDTPALVMTSGNLSEEPIVISNQAADDIFEESVDGIIQYNREIFNRVDDSVARVFQNKIMILRRSRGYAPSPILTGMNTEGILAVGAELVNSFCIGKGKLAIMSQYIGDLKNFENLVFFEETYEQYRKLFKFEPELIVTDYHPDYLSTRFGKSLSKEHEIPLIKVQHHHAHIASVIFERKIFDSDVIGICLDGMGTGENKETWGAEVFTANLSSAERLFHFKFLPLPGGDRAALEPWRMALSYLFQVLGDDTENCDIPLFHHIPSANIKTVIHMLRHDLNCPAASSAGRLFDAVAALTDICYFNSFEAEAPMRLESAIQSGEEGSYPYRINKHEIDFNPLISAVLEDLSISVPAGVISARFHNTLISVLGELAEKISRDTGIKTVVLSGGSFQNSYLTVKLETLLTERGFKVYLPESVPVNDQGIALGQLAIAAEMRKQGLIPGYHA